MKNIRKIFVFLLALILCMSFVACSEAPEITSDEEQASVTDEKEPDETETADSALNISGKLPETATYKKNDGTYLMGNTEGGIEFPETLNSDKFFYGGYVYTYNDGGMFDGKNGWMVAVDGDKTKETYGAILESINGYPIISLNACFKDCVNMLYAPEIPSTVVTMTRAFYGCSKLVSAPEIPSSVKKMDNVFYNCFELQGEVVVNATPESYEGCFTNTGHTLTLKGECTNKAELASTAPEGMITY